MRRNYQTNHRPENGDNSVERDQILIKPGESHDEFTHKIWARSDALKLLYRLEAMRDFNMTKS